MKVRATIVFSKAERDIIIKAYSPYHQLPDAEHQDLQRYSNVVESGNMTSVHVQYGLYIFKRLSDVLASQIGVVADPKWVADAAKATEAGKMLIVPNPQQAVDLLSEIRQGQLASIVDAVRVLKDAASTFEHLDEHYNTGLNSSDSEEDELVSNV